MRILNLFLPTLSFVPAKSCQSEAFFFDYWRDGSSLEGCVLGYHMPSDLKVLILKLHGLHFAKL
jgi:hypothetical protein